MRDHIAYEKIESALITLKPLITFPIKLSSRPIEA